MPDSNARKIILVEGDLSPGGDPSVTIGLARQLQSEGRQVAVICSGGSGQALLRDSQIPVILYPTAFQGWLFWRRWIALPELHNFAPDLLHAQTHQLARFAKALASRLECPYIITVRSSVGSPKNLPLDRKWLRLIIATSDPLREELVNDAKVPRELVRLIPRGVDAAAFRGSSSVEPSQSPALAESARLPDASHYEKTWDAAGGGRIPVVGIIAPLVKAAGHQFFIRAAKEVWDKHKNVQFLVAGQGPEADKLRHLVQQFEFASAITFVDYIEDHKLLLKAIDIFVLPALEEGFAITVLEAMASGRPVVVSGVGSLYSMVRDRETGFIVPRKDVSALSQAILKLIEDPRLAQELGQQALDSARNEFNQEVLFQRIVQAYEEVLASNGNGKLSR